MTCLSVGRARERSSVAQLARDWGRADGGRERPDPGAVLTVGGRVQPLAQPTEADAAGRAPIQMRLVFRPMQTPDPVQDRASAPTATEAEAGELVDSQPGLPS